jgi:glycosyltransferase involved in cell wall biosynthesis
MHFQIFSAVRSFGGGERYLSLLVPALRERGHTVEFVLRRDGAPEALRRLQDSRQSRQPTVRVFNGIGSLYRWGWLLPRRPASIYVHHSSLADDQGHWVKAALRPVALRHFGRHLRAVIRVCKASLPDGATACPIYTVFNGVEVDGGAGTRRAADEHFVIAMIGSLNANKNQEAAIRVLSQLPERFVLKLVGDGPALEQLRAYATATGVAHRVVWTGFTSDPLAELRTSHAVLILSRNEALPFSALEAMSVRAPVIAYRVGGLPELIVDGQNGLLVQRDDEPGVKRALLHLSENEEQRRRYGDSGVATLMAGFSVATMTDGFEAVARRVLECH